MSENSLEKHFDYVECKKCTYVHFQVSRKYAEEEVQRFNSYYDSLPSKAKKMFAGRSSVKNYETCMLCGSSYRHFRPMKEERYKEIYGHTINPIIDRKD